MISWLLGIFNPLVATARNPKMKLPKLGKITFAATIIRIATMFPLLFSLAALPFWKPVPLLPIVLAVEFGLFYAFLPFILNVIYIIGAIFSLIGDKKKGRALVSLGLSAYSFWVLKRDYEYIKSANLITLADRIQKQINL